MAKSTTSRILDVWSQVANLDRRAKVIIMDKLIDELCDEGTVVGEGQAVVQRPIEEGAS